MYAVINNSMGSGSVTYECEGHETRLSDCMSPLSSTIAPCYYALVKCFSTTDKKSGESNKTTDKGSGGSNETTDKGSGGSNETTDKGSGGTTTSGSSAGIVAGVVVSLLAVLLVVTIVIIILIVWLKRRDKNLKPGDNNATTTTPPSPTYASPVAVTGGTGANDVTLALGNPTYQPTHFQPAQTNGTPEHQFLNPLYSTAAEAGVNNE